MGFEPTEAESVLLSDQRSTSKPPRLGFGPYLVDLNNDGVVILFVCNMILLFIFIAQAYHNG